MLLVVMPLLLRQSPLCVGLLPITNSSSSSSSSRRGATHLRRQGVDGCEAEEGREGGMEGKED